MFSIKSEPKNIIMCMPSKETRLPLVQQAEFKLLN